MSQFWQKWQGKLQPAVAMEKARLPGRKWNSGFFSMGSTPPLTMRSATRLTSVPPRFSRTPQMPRSPGRMMQWCAQRLQTTDPSGRRS